MKNNSNLYILEPDHGTRVELRNILEEHFSHVFSFTKGVDLLEAVDPSLRTVDLVIISAKLLFMDPIEVINRIRKKPGLDSIPILLIDDNANLTLTKDIKFLKRPFDHRTINFIKNCLSSKTTPESNS